MGTGSNHRLIAHIEYGNGTLNFIQTEARRPLYNNGSSNYEYKPADHLGNSRLTFDTHVATPTIVQEDD